MTNRIRMGLIGTGMMGREHLRTLALFPDVQIAALADPTPASLALAQKVLGAPVAAYQDTAAMVRAGGLDAVIISSPNHTHAAVLDALWPTDLHILCEKPLCSDLEDAKRAADKAARHRGVFWTGMEYRFMPPVAEYIRQIHAGRTGRLVMLAIREHRFPFLVKVGDWNRFAANTGGTMVEKYCHSFDLMRLVVGAEAEHVYCSGAMDVNHLDELYDGRRPDIIDNAYTVVDFRNGVRAMLDLSMFADGAEQQEEICAVGSAAKLEVFIPSGEIVFSPRVGFRNPKRVERTHVSVDPTALEAGTHHGATYYAQRAFLGAILQGAPVQVTAEDGLRVVSIGAAAEISARERRAVTMAEFGF